MNTRHFKQTTRQMTEYFVYALRGAAITFSFQNGYHKETPYIVKKKIMKNEYDSEARQIKIKDTLEALCLRTYMEEKGITDYAAGLNSFVKHIVDLVPECHPSFRSEEHKTQYLCNAGAEFTAWSLIPIQVINELNCTYEMFAITLCVALQTHNLMKLVDGNQANLLSINTAICTNISQYSNHPLEV